MQYEERGALFVFEPDRERQCLAIGSSCKRVAGHLTRPHWLHSPQPGINTRSHTPLAHVLRTPIRAPDWLSWTLQPARAPGLMRSRETLAVNRFAPTALQTLHHISQFNFHTRRFALHLVCQSVCMEPATTLLQQLWNADSRTALATSWCSVCSHYFLTLHGWQILLLDDTVYSTHASLCCYHVASTAASLDSSTRLATRFHVESHGCTDDNHSLGLYYAVQ